MSQLDDVIFELEKLRKQLNSFINEEMCLTNSKIIEASQRLDEMLNKYNELTQSFTRKK